MDQKYAIEIENAAIKTTPARFVATMRGSGSGTRCVDCGGVTGLRSPEMPADVMIFIAGLFAWTLVEYVIHGVLGHAHRTFVTSLHDVHHRDPRAVFALGAWIPTAVVLAGATAWFGLAPGVVFYGGIVCGFAVYEYVHYRIHFVSRRRRSRRGCGRGIWRIMRANRTRFSG